MLLAVPLVASSLAVAPSDDWPQFRGPGGLAVAGDTAIPAEFGPDQNVLWKTTIPAGQSSPCVAGGRIFLSGYDDGKYVAVALDLESGEELWRKEFTGTPLGQRVHPDALPATPTAAADGEHVVFYFETYGLVAVDPDGKPLWEKRLEDPGNTFGVGTSPLLFDGLLVLSRDGASEAAILCYDVTDGSELWRIDRIDFGESHGSPFVWNNADRDELVIGGTNRLCSYDLGSGEPLWVVDGLTNFPCTTPTADADTLYFAAWSTPNATGRSFWEGAFARSLDLSDEEVEEPMKLFDRLDANGDGKIVPDEVPESRAKDAFPFLDRNFDGAWDRTEFGTPPSPAPGQNLMVAVARGAEGDATESSVRWTWRRGLPYVSSPLLYQGRVWLFKSGGLATCLDAKTGKAVFQRERLSDRSEYYMSPVGAAGRVIVGTAEGTLYVLDAVSDELEVTHTATFDEGLFATPAVIGGRVYLRTPTAMWAFGE
ncbi:MAG: PQQ-binding-like beta-propeller repeat protein [Planctomycetota bacterium]